MEMIIRLCLFGLVIYALGIFFAAMFISERHYKDGDVCRVFVWPLWFLCVVPIYVSKSIYRAYKLIFNIKWSHTLFPALMEDIKNAMESK